jgi:UDP-N-acetylglucosamine--N-acetylmuramyl-(pentapeptide) pyrophosphoryl-undecaprenol N-acetylglucosamine transferase
MKRMTSASRDPFQIFIFGGSGGAMGINTLILAALPFLEDLKSRLKWVHQTGEKDYDRVVDGYKKAGLSARIEKFIYDMPAVYQESSLLICRSGSSTLAEISAVGRAAILIPLPTAADNHQELNARVFEKGGAALCLRQADTTGEQLAKVVRELILNSDRLNQMEQAVTQFYFPNAAQNIVQALLG